MFRFLSTPSPPNLNMIPPPLHHFHYLTPDQYFTCLLGPDPFTEQLRWKLNCSTSLLQRFTAESSQEPRRNTVPGNKQRQVSMFLILLFKLLTQFPFLSILFSLSSLCSLFSILSLLPLHHPFFLF